MANVTLAPRRQFVPQGSIGPVPVIDAVATARAMEDLGAMKPQLAALLVALQDLASRVDAALNGTEGADSPLGLAREVRSKLGLLA